MKPTCFEQLTGRHDNQQNDIWHKDFHHNDIQHNNTLPMNVIMVTNIGFTSSETFFHEFTDLEELWKECLKYKGPTYVIIT